MTASTSPEPIAIIGIAFKFPQGAETSDKFWDLLVERRCAATEFPSDRFNIDAFWHPDYKRQNTIKPREAHFLDGDIRNFDAGFFSMAPHEVGAMDPQHRGIMETTYHAFENAGLRLEDVKGSRTSVHVGCFTSDFAQMQFRDAQSIPKYNALGSAGSILANRISWFYDLHGESMYVDTACSSGLAAMALGCQGLATGSSDMAVVGASNIILGPEFNISLSNMNFLSPEGRCHSFDAKGNGYARGEGFAVLVLKPVSKAIADRNPIRAVIRSIGMNQDGHTTGGITQPSKDLQVQLIRETYKKAGLDMAETRFFEAHGTGTAIGDPIEARAIGEAFFNSRSEEDPIYIGAVKSNVGHLEGTSGLAGVVKTVLALERSVIPPNTNFSTLNPLIDDEFFNIKFPVECIPWPKSEARRASVNSFGFGGSNAHVVLEAAESYLHSIGCRPNFVALSKFKRTSPRSRQLKQFTNGHTNVVDNGPKNSPVANVSDSIDLVSQNKQEPPAKPKLLILSASDEHGIRRQAQALAALSEAFPHCDEGALDDIIYTLNIRRTMLEWRAYCTIENLSSFANLEQLLPTPVRSTGVTMPKLGLVFTGQGAQWPRMGYELLEWPVFNESLKRSQKYLNIMGCEWHLIDEIVAAGRDSRINIPTFSQAISTAIQIALVDLIHYLDVQVGAVVGHSSGEIAAAYCAGFLCHESAMKVSYFRGLLASVLTSSKEKVWGMASVGLSADQLSPELSKLQDQDPQFDATQITVSCINSPANITISGPVPALDKITAYLTSKNVFSRRLKVNVGYHSPQMNIVASEYANSLSNLRPGHATHGVQMASSVVPGLVTAEMVCSSDYWVANMVSPVRFLQAIEFCCSNSAAGDVVKRLDRSHTADISVHAWLEVGPHSALRGPLREILNALEKKDLHYSSLLVRNKRADLTVLEAAGQLLCRNVHVDIDRATRLGSINNREPRVVVDLPQYAFNHSQIYWEESNRSRTYRLRSHGSHPLLGTQVMDWNSLDARWRFLIRKDEIPWVSDHRLHGSIWYPAAGMVVMAVEALKQLVPDNHIDVELRDVSFTSPIIVSENPEGTETQISMVQAARSQGKEPEYKFRIFVRKSDESWGEVCDGSIFPRKPVPDNNKGYEDEYKRQLTKETYDAVVSSCQSSIETSTMYQKISESTGLHYGPAFQTLTKIHFDAEGRAHATLVPVEEAIQEISRPCTIHPSTLDGIFQLAIPALSKGLTLALPTFVPSRLTRLWISHVGVGSAPMGSEAAYVRATRSSKRTAEASMKVFSASDQQIRVSVEELEVTEVARDEDVTSTGAVARAICHELDWKPDPTLLDNSEMRGYCLRHRSTAPEPEQWYKDLRTILLGFATQALEELEASGQKPIPSMERYAAWLKARLPSSIADAQQRDAERLKALEEGLIATSSRATLNSTIGRQLKSILVGETDPLQVLFGNPQCLPRFYEEVNIASKAFDELNAYLDLLVHKDPSLKVLEIGAGTGATTSIILDTIAHPEKGPRYSEYIFTDISGTFFTAAKARFQTYDRMQYRILDIAGDVESQGFALETYDVIIAANVLHATNSINNTIQNAHRLLKPNGKLILVEMTTPDNIETGFIFGSLPGWWLASESVRHHSAVVSESCWDDFLRQAEFSGTDLVFRDWDSEVCHGWSIMVSSATPTRPAEHLSQGRAAASDMTLVVDKASNLQMEMARQLQKTVIAHSDSSLSLVGLDEVLAIPNLESRSFTILTGLDRASLYDVEPAALEAYQKILTASKYVLWVEVNGAQTASPPCWATAEGLCRVCRSENPLLQITTLVLEPFTAEFVEQRAAKIAKVYESTSDGSATELYEQEFMENSGYLCINRLSQARYLDQHVFSRTQNAVRLREFCSGPPISLEIRVPGLLDTLEWIEDTSAYAALDPNQVEVRVQAIGVNFKECLTLLGRVNSDKLGSECSGYIARIGSGVQHLKVGDRVALGSLETYRTLVRAWEFQVVKIPDSMSFADAAAVPTAFCTAYHSLYSVARLQRGETILIHAAAGGTGQAAVQIAQYIGAEIFATVGSSAKRKVLIEKYGIKEDHIFNSRDSSFADGIKRMTNGRGVDVVLNSLSGQLLVASWEIIAEFGRFVEIGRKDIDTRGHLPMFPFIKNAMFAGVDLAAIVDGAAQSNRYVLQQVFDLMKAGIIRPPYPVRTYPIHEATQAFRLLQSGKSTGKIILEIQNSSIVPVRESVDSDYRFSGDATYVIAGGLGGIGRQIARWMVRRGAANILLLSRSGPSGNPSRLKMISEFEAAGVNIQYGVCDITDINSLRDSVRVASETMPPIKGCFQAAMVLRDRPFATMSHQEWCDSLRPKVEGSWNLHTSLPTGMDFFVMLSSAVGIFGNSGQANYAAGNTFQDALARYRVARGQKAVAIDLGMILGEGWVAERKDIQDRLMRLDLLLPLSQSELFALFDYYCDPNTSYPSVGSSQIITGIELPAMIQQSGKEIPESLYRPMFRAMHQVIPSNHAVTVGTTKAQSFATIFEEAPTLAAAGAVVAEALKDKLCKILGIDAQDKTINDRMDSFGVDSLIALELRNWLAKEMRADLAVYDILGDVKLIDTGLTAARKSEFRKGRWE